MLLPSALYRGPSAAGLPRYWIAVQSSGNPCRRSHSRGVRRRTADATTTVLSRAPPPPASSPLRIPAAAAASFHPPCPSLFHATATCPPPFALLPSVPLRRLVRRRCPASGP